MEKGLIIGFIVVLVLIAGVVIYSAGNRNISGNVVNSNLQPANSGGARVHIVEMSEDGFSPKTLEINVEDTIKFVNVGNTGHWPASAMHPTHTVYPGSDIKKCGTDEESHIFDACKNILPGESWSFTFNEKGNWGYHDHSNVRLFGKITVN